jgi:hypothetical protein
MGREKKCNMVDTKHRNIFVLLRKEWGKKKMSEAMMTHVFVFSKKLVKEKRMKIKKNFGGKRKNAKRKKSID